LGGKKKKSGFPRKKKKKTSWKKKNFLGPWFFLPFQPTPQFFLKKKYYLKNEKLFAPPLSLKIPKNSQTPPFPPFNGGKQVFFFLPPPEPLKRFPPKASGKKIGRPLKQKIKNKKGFWGFK